MSAMEVDDMLYLSVLSCAPVYDLIFTCLSPRSLIHVAQTCRAAYDAVANFKSRAFNINRHLSRFFADPIAFRSLQARTNTLVSGSNALQFLDRTCYPESDLDLYTHPGHSFEVARYITEVEGYTYSPREGQEPEWKEAVRNDWDGTERRVEESLHGIYPMSGITAVWSFKRTNVTGEELTVQVIEASSSPVEAILDFHSTIVMNFISSDAAYSLYPIGTFEERRGFGILPGRHNHAAVSKYIKRGWRIYSRPVPTDLVQPTRPPFLLEQSRWVGDRYTWIVPLDQTGIRPRPPLSPPSVPLNFDPVLCYGWQVRSASFPPDGYRCRWHAIQSTVFRYNYAVPEESTAIEIRRWAYQQGKYCHEQVPKEAWVWFDADIPSFLHGE